MALGLIDSIPLVVVVVVVVVVVAGGLVMGSSG